MAAEPLPFFDVDSQPRAPHRRARTAARVGPSPERTYPRTDYRSARGRLEVAGPAPATSHDPYARDINLQRARRARRYAERRRDLLVDITAAVVLAIVVIAVLGLGLIALLSGAAGATVIAVVAGRRIVRRRRDRAPRVARGRAVRSPAR